MLVSIIVPVLNEADCLKHCLGPLQALRGDILEIIVVDGGSTDDSVVLAENLADKVVQTAKGRALQMNAGARAAVGYWLLFLHADTHLPVNFKRIVQHWQAQQPAWGFFPVRLSGSKLIFRVIETGISWRSKSTGVGTGDQCIFVQRRWFLPLGGYREWPLMEDVELSKRLRKILKPKVMPQPVTTSSRRWQQGGTCRTILLMWRLRLGFFLGVAPEKLAKSYQQ